MQSHSGAIGSYFALTESSEQREAEEGTTGENVEETEENDADDEGAGKDDQEDAAQFKLDTSRKSPTGNTVKCSLCYFPQYFKQ